MRYTERGQREDEWLSLDHSQFGWLSEPGSAANPTFHPTLTPQKDAALDHAVRCASTCTIQPLHNGHICALSNGGSAVQRTAAHELQFAAGATAEFFLLLRVIV